MPWKFQGEKEKSEGEKEDGQQKKEGEEEKGRENEGNCPLEDMKNLQEHLRESPPGDFLHSAINCSLRNCMVGRAAPSPPKRI